MNADWTDTVLDLLSAVFLLSGAGFALLGAIGLLRFPDVFGRLHAAAKPQTLGILLILLGTAPQLEGVAAPASLVLVVLFQVTTAPIVAGTIGRVAHRTGAYRADLLLVNEFSGRESRHADSDTAAPPRGE